MVIFHPRSVYTTTIFVFRLKTQSKQFSGDEKTKDSTQLAAEVSKNLEALEEDYKTLVAFAKTTRQKFEDVQFICQVRVFVKVSPKVSLQSNLAIA